MDPGYVKYKSYKIQVVNALRRQVSTANPQGLNFIVGMFI